MSRDSVPAPLSWAVDAIERVGFERTLVVGLIYFVVGVVYVEARGTHADVRRAHEVMKQQAHATWGLCVNLATSELQIRRCGDEPKP